MKQFVMVLLLVLSASTVWAQPPNREDIVRQVDRQFPQLLQSNTHEANGEFLCRVIAAMPEQWGLLSKGSGENGVNLRNPTTGYTARVSHDVIVHRDSGWQVDIISGAANHPTPGSPTWGPINPAVYRPHNIYVDPAPLCGGPSAPIPEPPPPAGNAELKLILDRLIQLEAAISGLQGDLLDREYVIRSLEAFKVQLDSIEAKVDDARAQGRMLIETTNRIEAMVADPPPLRGSLFGLRITLRPQR